MNKDDVVLAGLAAGGDNAVFTPVQVQKLFFLIDREASHVVGGPHFGFVAYDYGPFDRGVYDALERLAGLGLAEITLARNFRKYSLTPEGMVRGQAVLNGLNPASRDYIEKLSKWVRQLSFSQLVSAVYKKYPDMKVNSVFQQ